jgi:hypothetical protein
MRDLSPMEDGYRMRQGDGQLQVLHERAVRVCEKLLQWLAWSKGSVMPDYAFLVNPVRRCQQHRARFVKLLAQQEVEPLNGFAIGELLKKDLQDTPLPRVQFSGPIGLSLTAHTDQIVDPDTPTRIRYHNFPVWDHEVTP